MSRTAPRVVSLLFRGVATLSCPLLLLLAPPERLGAQGITDYFNVESPQGHPLEVVERDGRVLLVACNTRDNSIEIFDAEPAATERRLARIRVGLEPVSVRYHAGLRRLFVASFLGDSISVIDLPADPRQARLLETRWVGDEPIDLAFYDRPIAAGATSGATEPTLFVTHMSLDGIDWRSAETLEPITVDGVGPIAMQPAQVTEVFGGVPLELAMKQPRTVLTRDDTLLVLALSGGNSAWDFDLYCDDLRAPFAAPHRVGTLGSAGLDMTFAANGDLFVVGAEALNNVLFDEPNVKAAPTGFVKSMLYRISDPCGTAPAIARRDVNLRAVPTLAPGPQPAAVATRAATPADSLSMLTGVVVLEATPQSPRKVFVASFGTDRIGVIEPDAGAAAAAWPLRVIDVAPVRGNPLAGPNGLALGVVRSTAGLAPRPRLWVLNHLDGSITAIDPVGETVLADEALVLANDPRPEVQIAGQRFLYDAKLSGNGAVSCSSCHLFGRTDGLAWDLGTPGEEPVPIPKLLPDAVPDEIFPADKNRMVTQSLQGLLNSEVAPNEQFWVTNAPYHWRGDRAGIEDFNGAFESLLGGRQLDEQQIAQLVRFVNSIHYPPNPKQRADRRPSPSAARGLELYHTAQLVGQRSCAHCHALPEGSNNRITDPAAVNQQGEIVGQPIETAALRGLFQKEAKRDLDGASDPKDSPYTGLEGLFHTGFLPNPDAANLHEINVVASINAFNKTAFSQQLCNTPGQLSFCEDLKSLNQFVHELDWGVGPLVGCPATIDRAAAGALLADPADAVMGSSACDRACGDPLASVRCMEQQAREASSGVAVAARIAGVERGFWFDAARGGYVEEPPPEIAPEPPVLSRAALLRRVRSAEDLLVFQATPLGSERRIAAPNGIASSLTGPAPAALRLLPMRPNAYFAETPRLTAAWGEINNVALGSLFLHTVRLFQWGLIQDAAAEGGFGVGDEPHHDAPRRFRISGRNIRHGAWMALAYVNEERDPIDPNGPIEQTQVAFVSLPLYATGERDPQTGAPVWETAVELEPLMVYGLTLGGPWAPGVAKAYLDTEFEFPMSDPALDRPEPGAFDPLSWNWHYLFVVNTDGTVGDGGWQRLRIEPMD